MKRKHAEMIKAWADDDSLVCFFKSFNKWSEINQPSWGKNYDYFLCLPKHKDACLHWLNGGEIQYSHDRVGFGDLDEQSKLDPNNAFMDSNLHVRIKPKKEKRWLGVNPLTGVTTNSYLDKLNVEHILGSNTSYQIIEIEVEV